MPESHKAERARARKQNVAAGIGDADGRNVRVKDAVPMGKCTQCGQEIRLTKTNVEAKAHADGKHGGVTFDVCFPTATAVAAELALGGKGKKEPKVKDKGPSKAQRKKQAEGDLAGLLDEGLSIGKKKGGKKK